MRQVTLRAVVLAAWAACSSPSGKSTRATTAPPTTEPAPEATFEKVGSCTGKATLADRGAHSRLFGGADFRPKSLSRMAIASDGNTLLTAGNSDVVLWDIAKRKAVRTYDAWMGRSDLAASGKRVVIVADTYKDDAVEVHDTATGKRLSRWIVKASDVDAVAIDATGDRVAIGFDDGKIEIREVASGASRTLAGHKGSVNGMAFSPVDSTILISAGKKQLWRWNAATGKSSKLPATGTMMVPRFSPDGATLVAGDSDGEVAIYDVATGKVTHQFDAIVPGEPGEVRGIAVSNGGARIVVGSWSGEISLWEPATQKLVAVLAEGGLVAGAVALSPDGKWVYGGVNGGPVRRWHASTGAEQESGEPTNVIEPDAVIVLADGRRAVVAGGEHAVGVWDLRCGKLVGRLGGHSRRVEEMAASRDRRWFATGGNDGRVVLFDGKSLEAVWSKLDHSGDVEGLAFSANGDQVASGGSNGRVVVRDVATGAVTYVEQGDRGDDTTVAVGFAGNGRWLLAGNTMGVVTWIDLSTGAHVAERRDDYPSNINSIVSSPDGRWVLTTASDTVRVFDAATSELALSFKASGWSMTNAIWFGDSNRIVFGDSDGHLWIAGIVSGAIERGVRVEGMRLESIGLSPDERHVLSGNDDTSLRLWDLGALPDASEVKDLGVAVSQTASAKLAAAHPLPRSAAKACGKPVVVSGDPLPPCAVGRTGPTRYQLSDELSDEAGVLSLSRDGNLLVAGGGETVGVFEVSSGRRLAEVPCCIAAPVAGALSPDNRHLLVTPFAGRTQVWDLSTGLQTRRWSHSARLLTSTPDGSKWATVSRKGPVRIVDLTGRVLHTLEGDHQATAVAFGPSGKRLAVVRVFALVELWDATSGKKLADSNSWEAAPAQLQDDAVFAAAPDGRGGVAIHTVLHRMVRSAAGKWSIEVLVDPAKLGDPSHDGVVCNDDASACGVIDSDKLHVARAGGTHRVVTVGEVDGVALSASGTVAVTANGVNIEVWDLDRDKRIGRSKADPVASVTAAAAGAVMMEHTNDLRLYRPGASAPFRVLRNKVNSAALSRDGAFVVAIADKKLIRIDAASSAVRVLHTTKSELIGMPALSADGTRVAIFERDGDKRRLRVLGSARGRNGLSYALPDGYSAMPLGLSEDGRMLAVAIESDVKLLSLRARKAAVIATINVEHAMTDLLFTPRGDKLITVADHFDVYSTVDGKFIGEVGDHSNARSAALVGGGRFLVSGGLDEHVRLFDLQSNRLVAVFAGHGRWVDQVAATDKPPRAYSRDSGGVVYQWDLSPWLVKPSR